MLQTFASACVRSNANAGLNTDVEIYFIHELLTYIAFARLRVSSISVLVVVGRFCRGRTVSSCTGCFTILGRCKQCTWDDIIWHMLNVTV